MGNPNDPKRTSIPAPSAAAIVGIAWLLGAGMFVATRYRGEWAPYASLHGWLSAQGVPEHVRQFDRLLLYLAASLVGAWIVARWRGRSVSGLLCLGRGGTGWGPMALLSLLPMVVGGAVLGWSRRGPDADIAQLDALLPNLLGGVVRAPIAEEVLFRGLLVGVCAAALGWRGRWFWCDVTASAMLFASAHVSWNAQGFAHGWPTLLVTFAGGMWYAWLLARWGSLWVPMALHAGMNLGWMLAAAGGGAGGGGWAENILRVATITIATWWTIRRTGFAAGQAAGREIG